MHRVLEETLGCTLYVTYMGQPRVSPFRHVARFKLQSKRIRVPNSYEVLQNVELDCKVLAMCHLQGEAST